MEEAGYRAPVRRSVVGPSLTIEQARNTLRTWVQWYNTRRPHSVLGYASPQTSKQQQAETYTHAA